MARQDLGKIISEITEINATVDNGVGVPSATATITGTATEKIVNIDFKNLKGDKGDKPENGVDYFTPEEKKQFTAETVKLVTDEGTKQTGLVGEKGVAETGKLTAEGNKQINLVIAEANKVIEQLKSLIEGNPETSNAQALSGKSRVEFERDTQALAGKYVGNFPLTVAVKDAVYLVPATGKFYVCTTAYNGTNLTAPNSNFEELSVYKNRDKLDNLISYVLYKTLNYDKPNEKILLCNFIELINNKKGIYEIIISCGNGDLNNILKKYIFLNPGYGTRSIVEVYSFMPGPYPKNIEIDTKTTDVFILNSFRAICKIFIRCES